MKWRTATEDDFTEDWMFRHYRYKFSNDKLDTDLFEVKDGLLQKIGGTGTINFSAVEILDENDWILIDYENIPKGEVLLLTTSKVILKGDWYKNGWRTEWSRWISTEDCSRQVILSTTPKEDVTHYCLLPDIPL